MNGEVGGPTAFDVALVLPGATVGEADRQTAFDKLFLEQYPRVVDIIGRVVNDRARAEDLAADVFWKLYRKSPERHDNMRGWLHRTAVRMAIDAIRRSSRRVRHEIASAVEHDRFANAPDPLCCLLVEERRTQVRTVLSRIKPRHARLLLLRASGLSYEEVARAIGRNPRSVGTLLARAQAQFDHNYRELYGKAD